MPSVGEFSQYASLNEFIIGLKQQTPENRGLSAILEPSTTGKGYAADNLELLIIPKMLCVSIRQYP